MMKIQNPKSKIQNFQSGYIALVSLLIVATAGLTIGLAVSLAGIDEIQVSHGATQAAKAASLAQTCVEDGLEKLRLDFSNYSNSLSIDADSCIIGVVVTGSTAMIDAIGTVDIYHKKIEVQVDDSLNVVTWQED